MILRAHANTSPDRHGGHFNDKGGVRRQRCPPVARPKAGVRGTGNLWRRHV